MVTSLTLVDSLRRPQEYNLVFDHVQSSASLKVAPSPPVLRPLFGAHIFFLLIGNRPGILPPIPSSFKAQKNRRASQCGPGGACLPEINRFAVTLINLSLRTKAAPPQRRRNFLFFTSPCYLLDHPVECGAALFNDEGGILNPCLVVLLK